MKQKNEQNARVDPGICVRGGPSPLPPLPLRSRVPLKPAKGICGSAVSCPSGVHGRAPTENEFGAFSSCEKATGGNHFEYSEVHVLQQNDQNLAQEYRHGVGPSPAVRPEAARTRCKSTTETDKHKAIRANVQTGGSRTNVTRDHCSSVYNSTTGAVPG